MSIIQKIKRLFLGEPEYVTHIKVIDTYDYIITTNKGKYRGGVTVWHDAYTGKRQSSSKEKWLSEIWTKKDWELQGDGW